MPINYLVFALLTGTLGFLLWYLASSSLRLPNSFQIQFDINTSYFNRILRRRLAGFLFYGFVPFLLIFHFDLLGNVSLADLGISFEWNHRVRNWLLGLVPIGLLLSWLGARKPSGLELYPEIRLAVWTPRMLIFSAFFWIIYLVGMEFLYRGLVLQSLLVNTGNSWLAILGSVGLYAMIHYFKNNRISLACVPYGLIIAYVTLNCGSLLPAIILHTVTSLATEWLSIYYHPEIRAQRRLYD